MSLKIVWSMLAALLLALLSGLEVASAARPGTAVGVEVVDDGFAASNLRHLHDTGSESVAEGATEEVEEDITKTVRRGVLVQQTASCPAGMTVAEVLECSSSNNRFTKVTERNKVVDGDVVGFTCGFKHSRFLPQFLKTTVTVRIRCEAPPPPPAPGPPSEEPDTAPDAPPATATNCRLTNGSSRTEKIAAGATVTNTKQCPKENGKNMALVDFSCESDNPSVVAVPEGTSMLLLPFPNNPSTTFNPGFKIYGGATCTFKNTASHAQLATFNIKVACQSQPDCSVDADCQEVEKTQKHLSLCIQAHSNSQRRAVTASCPAGTFSVGAKCSASRAPDATALASSKPAGELLTDATCLFTRTEPGPRPGIPSCIRSHGTTTGLCMKTLPGCTVN